MKNLIVLFGLFVSIASYAGPACVTNLHVACVNGSTFRLSGGNPAVDPTVTYTNLDNTMAPVGGMNECGQNQGDTMFTFSAACASTSQVVAAISWDCDPACLPNGPTSIAVILPAYCGSISVYIEECLSGGCCLTLCPNQGCVKCDPSYMQ